MSLRSVRMNARLKKTVAAYRQALEKAIEADHPLYWGMTENIDWAVTMTNFGGAPGS